MSIAPVGSEFQVNATTEGNQIYPDVVMDSNGNYVVVWEGPGKLANDRDLFFQRYNAKGEPQGEEFSLTVGRDVKPAMAMQPDGDFIVVWEDELPGGTGNIYGKRYDVLGKPRGEPFLVHENQSARRGEPDVAVDTKGNFVVTWQERPVNGISIFDIYAQRFDTNANKVGSLIAVNTFTKNLEGRSPAIAVDGFGEFVITWQGSGEVDGNGIYARHFNANGTPKLDREFLVNTPTATGEYGPTIAMNEAGDYVISWAGTGEGNAGDVYVRRFNTNDEPLTKDFRVNVVTSPNQDESDVTIAADGSFIVTWKSYGQDGSGSGVYARRFSIDGTPDGGEQLVNTFTASSQTYPAIAMNDNGNVIIAWHSIGQDGDSVGIFAQRFEVVSTVEFSQPTYQVNESGTPVGLAVTLERTDPSITSQVQVNVVSGTAFAGTDFSLASPFLVTFNPGETRKGITIPILQDTLIEGTEDLFLKITEFNRAQIGGQDTARVQILDDDSPDDGGNSTIYGTNRRDNLTGTNANETLVGMGGRDTIRAKGGDDVLIGVNPENRRPGKRERDTLIGDGGDDLFVLGDERTVFYNDGRRRNPGLKDYALIKGFNKKRDTIQLHGRANDYVLGSAPRSRGVGLFLEGKEDELIAVIRGKTNNLRLNSNAFEFV